MAESRPQLALSSTALLLLTSSISVVSGQTSGVFLSLNGETVPNDGYVLVSNIGTDINALLCNTDRSDCCTGGDHPNGIAQGHWYFPDGTEVMSFTIEDAANPTRNFFSRSRGTGIVRLSRRGNPPQSQRGRFRCVIPDASGMDVTLFVNIVDVLPPPTALPPPPTTTRPATTTQPSTTAPPVTTVPLPPTSIEIMVSIEPSGDNTIGGSYRLVCSVTVTGSTDTPTITWLDPMNNQITSGVMTTGSMSTLTFNPLAASHAGVYTCRATLGSAVDTASRTITLQVNTGIIVNYQVLSTNINFSLTCNSSGGPVSNVIWTRDGFLLDNTGPLVLTDASTFSYTNILVVGGRIPGTYTCQVRGQDDQVLSSTSISVQGSAPPVNVQATQSSSSAPVEVSWSPPSDGATNITGYRIFYGSGKSFLAPSYVTSIIFNFVESPSDVGPTVSIRSESMQLPSELIRVAVGEQPPSEALRTCSSEVGIAVGALILAEGFIAVVIAIIVIISWLIVRKRKSGKSDFAVSANMAYGQVKLDTIGERGEEYEDPDKLARSASRRQGDYELTEPPAPYEFPVSKPEAPVYATADETTTRGKTT